MMPALLLAAAMVQTTPEVPPPPAPPPPPPWAAARSALPVTPPPLVRLQKPLKPQPTTLVATDRQAIRSYEGHGHDEARGRLLQSVWPQIEALRDLYAKRLAGIYFDSDGALVLRLLGRTPVADRQLRSPSGGVVPVRFRTGWKLTDRQVMMKLQPLLPKLRRRLPTMSGALVDERTGALFVTVPGFTAADKAQEKPLSKLIGVPVRIGVFGGSD